MLSRLTTELWSADDVQPTEESPYGYERHVVVPGPDQTLTVLPADDKAAAAATMLRWTDATSPREAAIRMAGWIGLRTGLAAPLLRTRVAIRTAPSSDGGASLHSYLSDALDVPTVSLCCEFGSPRPNQKPIVRVTDRDGRTLAFAKVGWNPLTTGLIDNEAQFLVGASAAALRTVRVPAVLHDGRWRNRRIVLLAPVMGNFKLRRPPSPGVETLDEIANLTPNYRLPVASSEYWRDAESRMAALRAPASAREAMQDIEKRWGATQLRWGQWHGDWTPWNMRTHRAELIVWDWERTAGGVPVGFDPLHYEFHTRLASGRLSPIDAFLQSVAAAAGTVRSLGVTPDALHAVGALYALEMHLRFATADIHLEQVPPPRWLEGLLPAAVGHLINT